MDQIVNTAKDLISIKSVTSDKEEIAKAMDYVRAFFAEKGVIIKEFEREGSLLVSLKSENPSLLLHGHIDVVPASPGMFVPVMEGNKLFGRGAIDMKASLASMMHIIRDLSYEDEKPDIGLLITSDEETGGAKGAAVLSKRLKPAFVISGEPTDMMIGNKAKGVLELELSVVGKSAHAAYPWKGDNAISKMNKLISKLMPMFPKKGDYCTTINLSKISGGDVINKVPDKCILCIDIRYVPKTDPHELMKKIRALGFEVRIIENANSAFCPEDNPFIKKLEKSLKKNAVAPSFIAKHGASDVHHFTDQGIPGIVFGPKGEGIHSEEEYVNINSLEKFYNTLWDVCLGLR